MRLINRHDFSMKEFHGDAIPPYYILSHTWTTEEASFANMQRAEIQASLNKIANKSPDAFRDLAPSGMNDKLSDDEHYELTILLDITIRRRSQSLNRTKCQWADDLNSALRDVNQSYTSSGLNFSGVNTTGRRYRSELLIELETLSIQYDMVETTGYQKIKKMAALGVSLSRNLELSEALNSMSTYYADAAVCVAYLADVTSINPVFLGRREDQPFESWEFETSRWFTRGWTLQELLFPAELIFFDCDWKSIGHRHWPSIGKAIERATGIPTALLSRPNGESLDRTFAKYDLPVAQKMSWAAHRRTTRAEDAAYCLFGIFGVHIGSNYGEGGPRAFRRLQEQIIRSGSGDGSLFIWRDPSGTDGVYSGLLASEPSHFERNYENTLELPHVVSLAEDDYAELGNGCILLNVKMLLIAGITANMRLESASTTRLEDTLVTLDHRDDIFVPIIPGLQNEHGTYTSMLLRKDPSNSIMYTRIYPAWIVTFGQAAMRSSFAREARFVKARIRDEPILPKNNDDISLYGLYIETGALQTCRFEHCPILLPSEGHIIPVRHYGDICQVTYGLTNLPCKNGRHCLTLTYHGNTLPSDMSSWKNTLYSPGRLVVRTELLPKDLDELPNTHGKIHLPPEYGTVANTAGSSSAVMEEVRECPDCRIEVLEHDVSLWKNQAVLTVHTLKYKYQDHQISSEEEELQDMDSELEDFHGS